MPWYKSGTVSVTQNSNAVIGTSTAFIANSRVGDAFRGPDGGWYEITNIASDTAMSISPNYQGPTSSSGAYALAPMQGYVKDSADALRSLVNQFGAKLAALGTTGNYDILPVAKGGTGSSQPTSDFLTEGATNKFFTAIRAIQSALTGVVFTDASAVVAADTILAAVGKLQAQVTGKAAKGANSDITSLTGLTTALSLAQGGTGVTTIAAFLSALQAAGAYAKGNILGAVSQTGGVPTGAVIERGSNAQGEFVKFADGTMICTYSGSVNYSLTSQYGNNYIAVGAWNFPAQFVTTPNPWGTAFLNGRVTYLASALASSSSWNFTVVDPNGTQASGTYLVKLTAVGRWY